MAVMGNGAALNVAGKWLVAIRLRQKLAEGQFVVRVNSEHVKVSSVRDADVASFR